MSAPRSPGKVWQRLPAVPLAAGQISGLAKHEGFIAGQAYSLPKLTNDPTIERSLIKLGIGPERVDEREG
jgi:hypothetical protein